MTLMLDPPPKTLPMEYGMARPLRWGLDWTAKFQSRSLPRLAPHCSARITAGTSSGPPASSSSTLTSAFSARRRATTEPDEPEPQTMKSYPGLSSVLAFIFSFLSDVLAPAVPCAESAARVHHWRTAAAEATVPPGRTDNCPAAPAAISLWRNAVP